MKDNKFSFPIHPYLIDYSALYNKADAINRAYSSGNLVFFVGSGASKAYSASMPTWDELMKAVLSEAKVQSPFHKEEILNHIKNHRYLLAAEAIKSFGTFDTEKKDLAVDELVGRILKQRQQSSEKNPILHLSILDFSVPIFTTNFDNIIEKLVKEYDIEGFDANTYQDQPYASVLLNPGKIHEKYIFKLHGSIDKTQKLILDDRDYTDFYFHNQWPVSLQLLRHILSTKMVVFLGFSLTDPEIMLILREATRYSSSYQHIALMHRESLSSIEKDILRSNYRVDPIIYEEHGLLPLYIIEMRNFYHRETLPLLLRKNEPKLMRAIKKIRLNNFLPENSSAILFGSYAKYGDLSPVDADVDILFLTQENYAEQLHISDNDADNILNRKVDITVMARSDMERFLHLGDAFATNILITGCPLEDPQDIYGIMCRGFRSNYVRQDVLGNALERYQTRWIRLCLFENSDLEDFLQACYQWCISLMQLFVLEDFYPIDSILKVSLLGNARYVIREFANRYQDFDEGYFLSLMQAAKGIIPINKFTRPAIIDINKKLYFALRSKYLAAKLQDLRPGTFISESAATKLKELYRSIKPDLDELLEIGAGLVSGYGGLVATESRLLSILDEARQTYAKKLTVFDYLFFIRLHNFGDNEDYDSDTKLLELIEGCKKEWGNYISGLKYDA